MCFDLPDDSGQSSNNFNYARSFDEAWGGGNWMDRVGLGAARRLNDGDEDYTEETDVDESEGNDNGDDTDVSFGSSVVGGSSDPSLKRRQRGSKNRLRKMMRKDLKIPTGRSVVSVKGVG